MAWRVLANGAMIEIVTGVSELPGGGKRELSHIEIAHEGQIIKGDISQSMKDRYEANDPFIRSIIEYGEAEDVDGETQEHFEATGYSPQTEGSSSSSDGDDSSDRVAELEAQVAELQDVSAKNDDAAQAEIDDLKQKLNDAELEAAGALSYDDLSPEALKAEAEKKSYEVTRADGKEGDPLKADYVRVLEEARSGS